MKIGLALAALLALSACGGGNTAVSPSAVAAYQRVALSASTAVTSYRSATQTMTTPADCQTAVQQYAAQMGSAIQALGQTSSSMDDHMRSMGQSAAADMTCGAEVMAAQLQQHLGVACSSAEMSQNRSVAAQHCQLMAADTDRLLMRGAGLESMVSNGGMGGTMMGSGDMAAAMQSMMNGGFTAPDGQHMSWGDPMPGCTLSGGMYQPSSNSGAGTPSAPSAG